MSGDPASAPLIDEDHAEFVQRRVSILVAGRGEDRVPSVARAMGCRVSADRRRVTVFVPSGAFPALVDHVRRTGAVAVLFSLPSSHRTIQLKSNDAVVEEPAEGDRELMAAWAESFTAELIGIGYTPEYARTVVAGAAEAQVAIAFTPEQAFQQSPGPNAGTPLGR